ELKALKAGAAVCPRISRDALALLTQLSYIPAPHCIYEHISKLPPGSYVTIEGNAAPNVVPSVRPYWSVLAHVGDAQRVDMDESSALDRLESLLDTSVAQQMVADVPVGAFLSGGVDS